MKIRNGFVSNSSTASFVVRYRNMFSKEKEPLLSKSEVKKLETKGFFRTYASYPDQIPTEEDKRGEISKSERWYNYGYYIVCNEQEILNWLVKNKISFMANCHYDQYTVIYEKDSSSVYVLSNLGQLYMMGDSYDYLLKSKKMKKLTIEQFLKEGY